MGGHTFSASFSKSNDKTEVSLTNHCSHVISAEIEIPFEWVEETKVLINDKSVAADSLQRGQLHGRKTLIFHKSFQSGEMKSFIII
jgi:hypothetical protein